MFERKSAQHIQHVQHMVSEKHAPFTNVRRNRILRGGELHLNSPLRSFRIFPLRDSSRKLDFETAGFPITEQQATSQNGNIYKNHVS